jgi:hypothetical protein
MADPDFFPLTKLINNSDNLIDGRKLYSGTQAYKKTTGLAKRTHCKQHPIRLGARELDDGVTTWAISLRTFVLAGG